MLQSTINFCTFRQKPPTFHSLPISRIQKYRSYFLVTANRFHSRLYALYFLTIENPCNSERWKSAAVWLFAFSWLFYLFFFNRLIVYTGTSIPLACSGRRVAVKEFIGPPRWPQLNLRSRLAR